MLVVIAVSVGSVRVDSVRPLVLPPILLMKVEIVGLVAGLGAVVRSIRGGRFGGRALLSGFGFQEVAAKKRATLLS